MSKKSRPVKKTSAAPVGDKPAGWFERIKRLRLRFKRKGVDFQLLLEDPAKHLADIKRQAQAADTSEAALMRAALKAVLDKHAASRSVLAHLSVLEKALGKHGMKAMDELPADVLRRAMSQLETLVTDWSNAHLAGLRARLTTALIKHGRANDKRRTSERLSDFHDSKRMQVDEASVSTFMEVNAQWHRSLASK